MDRRTLTILTGALLISACQRTPRPMALVTIEAPDDDSWQNVVTNADMARIAGLEAAWAEALAGARKAGFAKTLAAEGPLLDPQAALARPAPTPGFYTCRILRFGDRERKQRAFTAFKPFFCYVGVNEDRLAVTKDSGSERPGGYLWDDRDNKTRLIFLGSVARGDEKAPLPYGDDAERDVAGIFERVEDFRFRLVMPRSRSQSVIDVLELVPAP